MKQIHLRELQRFLPRMSKLAIICIAGILILSACKWVKKETAEQVATRNKLEYLLCGDSVQYWRDENPFTEGFSNYISVTAFHKGDKSNDLQYLCDSGFLQPSWFIMSWKVTPDSMLTIYRESQSKDTTISKIIHYRNDTLFLNAIRGTYFRKPYEYRIILMRGKLNISKDTMGGKYFEIEKM